jgi:hypothetical protein
MKRLKTLLAVVAAMAMLLMATSLAMASTSIDAGFDPGDDFGQPRWLQSVTDSNVDTSCPPWATHQGCWWPS